MKELLNEIIKNLKEILRALYLDISKQYNFWKSTNDKN